MREAGDGKTNRRWGVEGVRGEKEEEEGRMKYLLSLLPFTAKLLL